MRKALLIGSETYGLQGCASDVQLMGTTLAEYGFSVKPCLGAKATRQEILMNIESLIDSSTPSDAVVVYYSGHGGMAKNVQWQAGSTESRYFQYLVPTDMSQSGPDDFRGILTLELSLLLARLTEKTPNVVVILDCCHSAMMSRDPWMRPRSLKEIGLLEIKKHLGWVRAHAEVDLRRSDSNPNAIRLVASGRFQSSYEYPSREHGPVGLFTENLVFVLRKLKDRPVSWLSLMKGLRERVLNLQPLQRPEVEGPSRRLLFELTEPEVSGQLAFFYGGSLFKREPSLRGGALLGVVEGDVYGLMPSGSERFDPKKQLGEAWVTDVFGGHSRVSVEPKGLPTGLAAFPLRQSFEAMPMALAPALSAELEAAIRDSCFLKVVGQTQAGLEVPARVELGAAGFTIIDQVGSKFGRPTFEVGKVVTNLVALARARALWRLGSGEGNSYLNAPFEFEWGRVVAGRPQKLDPVGAQIFCGDHFYLKVTNKSDLTLYVNVFDIGVSCKISLLNRGQPSGIEIQPMDSYCLGEPEHGGLKGLRMYWPPSMLPDGPRPERFMLIVSDQPQDLTCLERGGVARSSSESSLQKLLSQLRTGVVREVWAESESDLRYAVAYIDFDFYPSLA